MEVTSKPKETRQARDWHARRACEDAYKLERAGDYEGARSALGKLWTRIGESPRLDQFPIDTQAEVLWRVGSLSGWIGSAKQIPGAQAFARDLLTESITRFEFLGQQDKRAEAMGDLALCYWRLGEQDNGRALFREAVKAAQTPQTKLRMLTNASTVEISSGRYEEALSLLNAAGDLLAEVSDDWMHGSYHFQRGLVYRNLENVDEALVEYKAASVYLANAGHTRYLARVENNLGFILLQLGRTTEALIHLDKARVNFVSLKDSGSVAQVNETRARVFLAQKRLADAERAIFDAIATLEKGEDSSLLAEALTTAGSIFAGSGKYDNAREAFNRASDIAAAADDSHLAAVAQLRMIEDLGGVLSRAELLTSYRRADEYIGDRPSQSQHDRLRLCRRIVLEEFEKADSAEEGLIGGTLDEEVNHYEKRLIARALERHNGSITRAARELGVSRSGLSKMLNGNGRHRTLGGRQKRRNPVAELNLR